MSTTINMVASKKSPPNHVNTLLEFIGGGSDTEEESEVPLRSNGVQKTKRKTRSTTTHTYSSTTAPPTSTVTESPPLPSPLRSTPVRVSSQYSTPIPGAKNGVLSLVAGYGSDDSDSESDTSIYPDATFSKSPAGSNKTTPVTTNTPSSSRRVTPGTPERISPDSVPMDLGSSSEDEARTSGANEFESNHTEWIPPALRIPDSPKGEPSPDCLANVINAYERRMYHKIFYNQRMRAMKKFRNPNILGKIVERYGIDGHGSNFPVEQYNPKSIPGEDCYLALNKEHTKAEFKALEESKKRKKIDFSQPSTLRTSSSSSSSSKRHRRRSKWDQPTSSQNGKQTSSSRSTSSSSGHLLRHNLQFQSLEKVHSTKPPLATAPVPKTKLGKPAILNKLNKIGKLDPSLPPSARFAKLSRSKADVLEARNFLLSNAKRAKIS